MKGLNGLKYQSSSICVNYFIRCYLTMQHQVSVEWSEHTCLISSFQLLSTGLWQTQVARWKAVASEWLTCVHLYLDIADSGYFLHIDPGGMWTVAYAPVQIQYIPRNMHTVFALLCFVVVIHWLIFPYPSGLLHWHCGNLTIAPVPAKQPWWIWINSSCEFIMNDCITTTKQSTTKPCAYFLWYTVCFSNWPPEIILLRLVHIVQMRRWWLDIYLNKYR